MELHSSKGFKSISKKNNKNNAKYICPGTYFSSLLNSVGGVGP